jgi:hypothetical protein
VYLLNICSVNRMMESVYCTPNVQYVHWGLQLRNRRSPRRFSVSCFLILRARVRS